MAEWNGLFTQFVTSALCLVCSVALLFIGICSLAALLAVSLHHEHRPASNANTPPEPVADSPLSRAGLFFGF